MDCNKNEIGEIKRDSECVQRSVETNNNFEPNKETSSSGGGDIDSVPSDGSKISESREERIKRIKEKSEAERQRKYTEIIESQRQANQSRQKLQEDRRKKIEEIKQREEERKKKVEQRRQEMDAKEKEKNEGLLRRTKEREARAIIIQKQVKMVPAMTQSMTNANDIRMTSSSHSNGNGSGSEKCKKVYHRSSSGCDVDRVSRFVLQAAGNMAATANMSRPGTKRPQIPDGFIEVGGHIIPANTRHVGCFVPYKGSEHTVKGVLAWRPPSDRVVDRGGSMAWWEGIRPQSGGCYQHQRASSAHATLVGPTSRHRKDSTLSPRVRSTSRHKTTISRLSIVTKSLGDQSLYDRLSKPRGVSQPPKGHVTEPSYTPQKNMSSSFRRQSTKAVKKLVTVPTTVNDKRNPQKRKSLSISAPDSGLTSSPASEMESTQESKDREELPEITSDTLTEELATIKIRQKKNTKNLHSKDPENPTDSDNAVNANVTTVVKEEETYRLKLTEQRRLAREAKERQQEEHRRLEQEAHEHALAESSRIEEETRQIMEEEAKRLKQLEDEEQAALTKEKVDEETERIKKEELERELEEKRMEKSRSEDTDRMERKRRLEKIMSRVKKPDESSSQSNEESAVGISEFLDNSVLEERRTDPLLEMSLEENPRKETESLVEPIKAWDDDKEEMNQELANDMMIESENGADIEVEDHLSNNGSPCLLSDNVLDLPGPETNSSYVSPTQLTSGVDSCNDLASSSSSPPQPPQFKSRLLQSIMSKGRHATSNSDVRVDSPIVTSNQTTTSDDIADGDNCPNFIRSQINGRLDNTDFVLHIRSYDNDIDQMIDRDQSRNSLSYESQLNDPSPSHSKHHSDTDNEVTLSSLASNLDPAVPPSPGRQRPPFPEDSQVLELS